MSRARGGTHGRGRRYSSLQDFANRKIGRVDSAAAELERHLAGQSKKRLSAASPPQGSLKARGHRNHRAPAHPPVESRKLPRWTRLLLCLLGAAAIPVIPALFRALIALCSYRHAGDANVTMGMNSGVFSFICGFCAFLVAYALWWRPMRLYVIGHELTHALFALLHGRRVWDLRVLGQGGSIKMTKAHLLTVLAPYFFPFYAMAFVLLLAIASIAAPVGQWRLVWMPALGFLWGFHFCFTVNALLQRQTDVEFGGYIFSYVLIILLNLAFLAVGIVVATPCSWGDLLRLARREIGDSYFNIAHNFAIVHDYLYTL